MDEDGKTALSGPVDVEGVGIARTLEKNARLRRHIERLTVICRARKARVAELEAEKADFSARLAEMCQIALKRGEETAEQARRVASLESDLAAYTNAQTGEGA